METFHSILRWSHIVVGTLGLLVYWVAALTKKGGTTHKRAGRWFVYSVYYIVGTALFSTLWGTLFPVSYAHADNLTQDRIDGIRFFVAILTFLATLTLSAAVLGVRSLRAKKNHSELGSPLVYGVFAIQAIASLWLAWTGYDDMNRNGGQRYWICFILAGVGISDTVQQLLYIKRKATEHMAWFIKHIECMVGCGAAFHTAAIVTIFSLARVQLPGVWGLVPWVAPTIVALTAGTILKKKYRSKFGSGKSDINMTTTEPSPT